MTNYKEYLINLRRHFHMYPEVGFNTKNTAKYISDNLKSLGYDTYLVMNECGVIAKLNLGKEKTIALRSETDALEIEEKNSFSYKSTNNYMHACGHDSHMAILLTTAKLFIDNIKRIKYNITLVFQPAEEGPLPGGALSMIATNLLNDCDMFYSFHVTNKLKSGTVGIKHHETCAAPDLWELEIYGKGCHASNPKDGVNPILVASNITLELENYYQSLLNSNNNVVITSTYMKAGVSMNIIPDVLYLKGTARSFNDEMRHTLEKGMNDIFDSVCKKYNASYKFTFHYAYDPVYNDDSPTLSLLDSAIKVLKNKNVILLNEPLLIGDDFSYYRRIAPTCYTFLGVREKEKEYNDLHSPFFSLDENNLLDACLIYLDIFTK